MLRGLTSTTLRRSVQHTMVSSRGLASASRAGQMWSETALSLSNPLSGTVGLDEEQVMFYETAAAAASDVLAPFAAEWDEKEVFPVETLKGFADLGFGAIYTSDEHGGTGASRLDAALVFEALSMGCPSTTAYLSIHNMCTWMVDTFGSDELRGDFVPALASMDKLSSYCLTEPGSGSDAAALRTTAVADGDDYILNGEKAFISGGGETDLYVIMARTGDKGPGGISCFLVEDGSDGLSYGSKLDKLGWNSSPTRPVVLQDVRVPARHMLGNPGEGFKIAMKGLDGGRINIGACSIGAAAAAVDFARGHVQERTAFGKPLSAFQNTEFKFADMATKLRASRLIIREAASLLDQKSPLATSTAAMAKRLASDHGFDVINDSLQMLGGYGYTREYPIERYLRDARVHQILEGTNEIQLLIIARALFQS